MANDSLTSLLESDSEQHVVLSKALPSDGSITEPESDEPQAANILPLPLKALPSDGSITEPESYEPINIPVALSTPKPIIPKLGRKWFATPSPPPPDSIYWKYFTQEEEARFYDRSGTDKSFQAVRKLKYELQESLDNESQK